MENKPLVTCVTCVKNRPSAMLERFQDSLLCQTTPYRLLVVSYGSDPEHLAEERRIFGDQLLVAEHDVEPFRQGRALNIGLCRATTPFVFTTDIDHILGSNFVTAVEDALLADADALVTCRRIDLDPDGQRIGIADQCYYGTCIGAARHHFEALGGFDEFYSLWGDVDVDMVDRLVRLGLHVTDLTGKTFAFHQWHPASAKATLTDNSRHREQMQSVLVRNSHGWGEL